MARDKAASAAGRATVHHKPFRRAIRSAVKQNMDSNAVQPAAAPAIAQGNSGPLTSQTLGIQFTGSTIADKGLAPPDTMGAAGPTQFIVAVNNRFRSFDKTTGAPDGALDVDPDVFFASVETPIGTNNSTANGTSDPHIRFDRLSGRWIIVMIDTPTDASNNTVVNRVMVAVSSGGTIASKASFTFFFFQQDAVAPAGDTGSFADYPTPGIDANAVYVGFNIFSNPAGNFQGCTGFVIRKSSILGAGPIVATAFRGMVPNPGSDGPYTPQGVDNYDPAATEGYFLGVSNSTLGNLVLRRVSNPGGAPTISANISIPIPATQQPINIPHLGNAGGSSRNLDADDDRLFAAHIRNGRLWTAHHIQVDATGAASAGGGRDGARWYELKGIRSSDTQPPSPVQSGTIFDPAVANPKFFIYPTIVVSGQGHAAMGFTTSGASVHINAATTGRLAGDALGTMQTINEYTASSSSYNANIGSPQRWGDYSFTCVDPSDDMTMWTIQEFCDSTDSYGVRAVKLIAPPPATPASIAPTSVADGASNVNVVLTGTSAAGSGFFDPGAGFTNRLAASVSGTGVTVNSVTFTDPTHITLNITVAANAPVSTRTITVTNPDGQSLTSTALLSITSAGTAPAIVSAASASFVVGVTTNFTVTTTGTPVPSITRGGVALPTGVTFVDNGDGTGKLSGMPGAGTAGSYALTFTAANGFIPNAVQNFTLTVAAAGTAPAITSAASGQFFAGVAGTFTVTTTGSPTPVITRGGAALPAGLTFVDNGDGTGKISGTPGAATAGNYALTFTAANGIGANAQQNYTLTVSAPVAPSITSVAKATFSVGSANTFTVTTSGTPTPAILRSGAALPSGVTFVDNGNGTGKLSGTPGALTAGTYALVFTASNGLAPDAVQNFTLSVGVLAAPSITSANAVTFTQNSAGAFAVTTSGFPTPAITIGGAALPAGVTFVDNGDGTGTLSGTSSVTGTFALTFTASNGVNPVATQNFTLTVSAGGGAFSVAPAILSPALTTFTENVAGTFSVTVSGVPAPVLSVTGTLPSGVTFDTKFGVLSGTPAAGTAGAYPLTFTASNTAGMANQPFMLTVLPAPTAPTITSADKASFSVNAAGSFTVKTTGSPIPSIVLGGAALPTELTFKDNGDGTATLSGTPLSASLGSYALAFTASNGTQPDAVQKFTLTIISPVTIVSGPFASPASAGVGQSVSFSVFATGASVALAWDFGDGTTGSGSPVTHSYDVKGSYTATVKVSNGAGAVTGSVQIDILAPLVGTGKDTDGDGFSDDFEKSVGSDPFDQTSTPIGGAKAPTPGTLSISSATITLNFAKSLSDTIKFSGTLQIPAGFAPAGSVAKFVIGSIPRTFTLDGKGNAKSGNDSIKITLKASKGASAAQVAKYTVTLAKGTFAMPLSGAGFTGNADLKGVQRSLPIIAIFNKAVIQKTESFLYSAKQGKTGMAKGQ